MRKFKKGELTLAMASVIVAVLTLIGTIVVDKESEGAVTNFIYNVDTNTTKPCEKYYINPSLANK